MRLAEAVDGLLIERVFLCSAVATFYNLDNRDLLVSMRGKNVKFARSPISVWALKLHALAVQIVRG